jgi:hypothetical protein
MPQYLTPTNPTDLIAQHTAQAIARLELAGLDLAPVDEDDEDLPEGDVYWLDDERPQMSVVYAVHPERVTWVQPTDRSGRTRITHPWVYTVTEDGNAVRSFDTRGEADSWIAAQS